MAKSEAQRVISELKEKVARGEIPEGGTEKWIPTEENPQAAADIQREADGNIEVVTGEEEETPEEKPAVSTISPEELAALRAQADTAKALREVVEGLASRLAQPAAPPVNTPVESPEEFFEKHADEIFDPQKGAKVLRKYTEMVGEQKYGKVFQGLSTELANTRKELLESRDPYFKRWKGEVEALVAQQPAEVRSQPNIWELAWQSVRQKHSSEIEAETIKEKVDAAVAEALKAHGIEAGKRPPVAANGEARSAPQGQAQTRKVRLPDAATEARLRAEATRKGMDFNDLLIAKGYIK